MGRRSERLSKQGRLAADATGEDDVIQVVSRAFDVLRCFEGHDARLGNLEISNRCGLPRSTVSRLTHTLTRMGQLVYLPRDQKYRIGPSAVAMSTSMMRGLQLRHLIRLRLQEVAEQLPGTVGFVIPDRFHLVYLEVGRAANALGLSSTTGTRVAMASTAAGHAYTAALDTELGDALLAEMEREIPENAKLLRPRLEANRRFLRERGYVVVCGLWSPHINGLAVPLWSPQYQTYVVVTIGLLSAIYDEKRLHKEVAPRILELSAAIGAMLEDGELFGDRAQGEPLRVSDHNNKIARTENPNELEAGTRRARPARRARVPVVGLGLGSVAGLGAARLAASHYSVMTKNSAMFVAGPPVVKRLGQDLSKQELGGADIQTRAGGVDHAVDTEEEAFACAKRFLSYLPSSVYELPPTIPCDDDPERAEESLLTAVPRNRRQVYKMRPIINTVVDRGSFFEMGANFGRPIIVGLARLEGRAVLVLAGDPFHYGGSWTAEACQKVVRWVDFAETFHLPIVYLMDCPGFMIGLEAEKAATIRHGVRAMAAVNQTTVPWCTIIVRNSFGVAGVVHQPADRFSMRYAWPSAYWGSLPLEGGIEAAYRADIDAAEDPQAKLREIEDRLNKLRSPFRSAEKFWVEEIIDPRKTRSLLCEFARLAEPLRTPGPATNMTIRP